MKRNTHTTCFAYQQRNLESILAFLTKSKYSSLLFFIFSESIPSNFCPPSSSRVSGYTLQFFVKKNIVDDVSYICQPYGIPITEKPSEHLSSGRVDGQSRLFAHPSRFTETMDIFSFLYPRAVTIYICVVGFCKKSKKFSTILILFIILDSCTADWNTRIN